MTDSVTITLAGKDYTIRPLTLGAIEELSIAVVVPTHDDPQENTRRNFARSIGILRAAMAEDYAEMTTDAIRLLRVTRNELNTAVDKILVLSGLVAPGEEEAADQSTGSPSTAG